MRAATVLLSILVAGCASAGAGTGGEDLIALVDLERDALKGTWKREGGSLVTPAEQFGRLQIRCAPPAEYDVTAEVVRVKGKNSLVFGLRLAGKLFAVMLDSDPESTSGIDQVAEGPFYDNATTYKGKLFETGKPMMIRCSVRKGRVRVSVDGQRIIDWPAEPAKLGLYPLWKTRDDRALFIGSWETVFRIKSLALVKVLTKT